MAFAEKTYASVLRSAVQILVFGSVAANGLPQGYHRHMKDDDVGVPALSLPVI
jgi:hypothetical protein